MGKHLVMVGGGHAHMTTMARLREFIQRGHRVTLIGPSPYHYYSGMGPGMLSGMYKPGETRFHVKKMVEDRGASFAQDTVVKVDPGRRILFLSGGGEIEYDVVSFNIGSNVPLGTWKLPEKCVFTVKPIENLVRARQMVMELIGNGTPELLVIGGGPGGLEIAGNLWRVVHDHGELARITVLAGRKFCARLPAKARRLAKASLTNRDMAVVEGSYVKSVDRDRASLEDGREYPFDLAILALGVKPPPVFSASGLSTGQDGGLLVNAYLQSVDHPEIFGGGDCISFKERPLDKVGVYALRQNVILYENMMASLDQGKMRPFQPPSGYTLIFNLGDGQGIFWRGGFVWGGRFPFWIKDYIDRKFMRRFQVSGEREEQES